MIQVASFPVAAVKARFIVWRCTITEMNTEVESPSARFHATEGAGRPSPSQPLDISTDSAYLSHRSVRPHHDTKVFIPRCSSARFQDERTVIPFIPAPETTLLIKNVLLGSASFPYRSQPPSTRQKTMSQN